MKILHVVTGLGIGGAEYALARLVSGLREHDVVNELICLNSGGPALEAFERARTPLTVLDLGRSPLPGLRRALRVTRRFSPHLIQGWMYHGNLAASLLGVTARSSAPVIWNIRHSVSDIRAEKRSTRWVIRAGAAPLWKPQCVVYNSQLAREEHRGLGYLRHPDAVIANGVASERFKPSRKARSTWRRARRFAQRDLVVGLVARYHATKDPDNFLSAAMRLAGRFERAQFVMIGTDMTGSNAALVRAIQAHHLQQRVHLLGAVAALEHVYPGLDVLVVSSFGEGLPNVILEAMACGIPAVTTAVGDAPRAVLDARFVVPPRDPDALAETVGALLSETGEARRKLGESCRAHILAHYDDRRCTSEFLALYRRLLGC